MSVATASSLSANDFSTYSTAASASRLLAQAGSATGISGGEQSALLACFADLRLQGFDLLSFAVAATRNPRACAGYAASAFMGDSRSS